MGKKKQSIESLWIDIMGYSDMQIDFFRYGKFLETTDSFNLYYSFDSSNQWVDGGNWTNIENKKWNPESVTFSTGGKNIMMIRFQTDFNNNKKRLSIDNIIIQGKLATPTYSPTAAPVAPAFPTDVPTHSPTITPVWEVMFHETFETVSEVFVGGKFHIVDKDENENMSLRIKKKRFARTDWYSVSNYSQLKVDFSFFGESMEAGEGMTVAFKFDEGSSDWITVEDFIFGEGFDNGIWYEASVSMAGIEHNRVLLRLKVNGNQGNDMVYFDNITLSALE